MENEVEISESNVNRVLEHESSESNRKSGDDFEFLNMSKKISW